MAHIGALKPGSHDPSPDLSVDLHRSADVGCPAPVHSVEISGLGPLRRTGTRLGRRKGMVEELVKLVVFFVAR
jgi:hypothetical protein